MSRPRRVGVVAGLAALTILFVGAVVALLPGRAEPAADRYDRLALGMTLDQAREAMRDPGTADPPGDTTGRFLFDRSEGALPPGAATKHFWRFADGLVAADFGPDGAVAKKTYLSAAGR